MKIAKVEVGPFYFPLESLDKTRQHLSKIKEWILKEGVLTLTEVEMTEEEYKSIPFHSNGPWGKRTEIPMFRLKINLRKKMEESDG